MDHTIGIILGLILLGGIVYGGSKFEKTNNGERTTVVFVEGI